MDIRKYVDKFEKQHSHRPLALVTGASSGMGRIFSGMLSEAGCDLVIVSNQEEPLEEVATAIRNATGVSVITSFRDLSAANAAEDLKKFCDESGLQVDILINNAGIFFFEELNSSNLGKAETMMMLHNYTTVKLCVLFGEEMKKRGYGYMLNVSSLAASLPVPGITMYSATKAFLKTFGKAMYYEMRPYGVGMTTVCPAAIATPLYGLKDSLMNLGKALGVINTPEWLVRKALRGMFRGRRIMKPGPMNIYLPPLLRLFPGSLETRIWTKYKQ